MNLEAIYLVSAALAGVALTIGTAITGAVWAVAKIKGTTEVLKVSVETTTTSLRQSIDHLSSSIEALRKWIQEVSMAQNRQSERLARLEAHLEAHLDMQSNPNKG